MSQYKTAAPSSTDNAIISLSDGVEQEDKCGFIGLKYTETDQADHLILRLNPERRLSAKYSLHWNS